MLKRYKKIFYKIVLKKKLNYAINKITYLDLYEFIFKLNYYLSNNNIKTIVFDIENIRPNYLIILFLTSFIYGINLYTYLKIIEKDDIIIDNKFIKKIIYNKNKINTKFNFFNIDYDSNINYKLDNNYYKISWLRIFDFYKNFNCFFNILLKKNIKIHLFSSFLQEMYTLYFIPLIIFNNVHLIIKKNIFNSFIISNNLENFKNNYGIFISNIYTKKYPNNTYNLFYSLNLNQFLLYNVVFYDNKLVGKIFSNYKIFYKNDKLFIIYNNLICKLPSSYFLLTKNLLKIKRNFSRIIYDKNIYNKISINCLENYYIKYNFSKLIYLDIIYNLDYITGERIYKILLNRFHFLNINNYNNINLSNNYKYNTSDLPTKNSLFSIYIKLNQIILHISYIIEKYESLIINDINAIIIDFINSNEIVIKKKNYNSISNIKHLVELKYFIRIGIFIVYVFLINIKKNLFMNSNINNNKIQINYYFNDNEVLLLKKKCDITNENYSDLFRFYLLKSLNNIFKDFIVILDNNKLFSLNIYDSIDFEKHNKLDFLLKNSIIVQNFLMKLILKNPKNILQISENILNNKLEYITIKKYNTKCDLNDSFIQINYTINYNKEILVTISFNNNIDKIKKIISELINNLNNINLNIIV